MMERLHVGSMKKRLLAAPFAVAAALAVCVAPAASAAPAATDPGAARAGFSAQARSLGLDSSQAESLQARVDGYLAKTPGASQVAANKINLSGGGELLLTLPGEERARDLGAAGNSPALSAGCPYTYVCAYSGENFTGEELRLFTCNYPVSIGWSGTGSWINNQRSTLYARFYDRDHNVGWTSPGGYSEDRHAPWGWVYWLSPC
ncbi:peptidase inhibitor family I36 protein [Kitasatospora purpeofusca]|uniref:Peptidase inhibitor family I36 protein n=1 Tax=Kitasatospora purpeofusca TaxID=67352 RepID=A0ABZ1UAK9_9ACTN|nr:peptidase inhibitor family I36 protein [Kitasatospora purpeofusca]